MKKVDLFIFPYHELNQLYVVLLWCLHIICNKFLTSPVVLKLQVLDNMRRVCQLNKLKCNVNYCSTILLGALLFTLLNVHGEWVLGRLHFVFENPILYICAYIYLNDVWKPNLTFVYLNTEIEFWITFEDLILCRYWDWHGAFGMHLSSVYALQ